MNKNKTIKLLKTMKKELERIDQKLTFIRAIERESILDIKDTNQIDIQEKIILISRMKNNIITLAKVLTEFEKQKYLESYQFKTFCKLKDQSNTNNKIKKLLNLTKSNHNRFEQMYKKLNKIGD